MGGIEHGRARRDAGPAVDGSWPRRTLLGGLTPPARQRLLGLGALTQYTNGKVIIREAERTTSVRILLDGVVKATARTAADGEALLAVRVGGDLVGELAALDGEPRSATVTACSAVLARLVSRDEFLAFLRRDPEVSAAVSRAVATKLRAANDRRVEFAGCPAPTRIARVLHQIARVYGERDGDAAVIRWPLTQPELASLAGTAEPTVFKTLRELRVAGIVSTGYKSIRVNSLTQLKKIAFADPP
jgi:CRP/FNR family transcriptional regulator, cyclic AMP receptor protein